MNFQYIVLAIFVGAALPLQGIVNAKLGAHMDHPMHSTLISYIGGIVACIAFLIVAHPVIPDMKRFYNVDWYLYLGGFLGTIFVSGMLYIIPKIGATNMLAAAIVGQLILSLSLDHYGAFGIKQITITPNRILGIFLLLAGLVFIKDEFSFTFFTRKL